MLVNRERPEGCPAIEVRGSPASDPRGGGTAATAVERSAPGARRASALVEAHPGPNASVGPGGPNRTQSGVDPERSAGRMIHLDTGFLINALRRGSVED